VSAVWQEAAALAGSRAATAAVLRTAVDGFLAAGDQPRAWEALERLLLESAAPERSAADVAGSEAVAGGLVPDGVDPLLAAAPTRWMRGRLDELLADGSGPVQAAINRFVEAEAVAITGPAGGAFDPAERAARLRRFIERFGGHAATIAARRLLADTLAVASDAAGGGDEGRDLVVERDFVLLELARSGPPADREHARQEIERVRATLAGGAGGGAVGKAGVLAEAWPIGRVAQRRGSGGVAGRGGETAEEARFVRSRMMHIPVVAGGDSFLPGLDLAVDIHQQSGIVPSDGFGRQIGDPLRMQPRAEGTRLMPVMPVMQPGGVEDASVLGRCVFARTGGTVAAFELTGQPGGRPVARPGKPEPPGRRNRQLWLVADKADPTADARAAGFAMHVQARVARDGAVPLGVRASEPRGADDAMRRGVIRGAQARVTGVPVLVDRMLRVHDPKTGALTWERHRLPAGGDLFGDDDYLCVCPADGRGAVVLSMIDGRVLRSIDLPRLEQRLLTSGRRVVAVQPSSEGGDGWSQRVKIEVIDPAGGERLMLGEFPGDARATPVGEGRLAVVEPSGRFTLLDLEAGRAAFHTKLTDMPNGLQQLHVMSWDDRYIVVVSRAETDRERAELDAIGGINALPGMPGSEMPMLVTGSVWAVDRASGDMLWPVPATILRHGLQRHQATELPVLVFARAIQPVREPERPRLSVLCLDKRTGAAVFVDDRFNARGPSRPDTGLMGLGVSGDPTTHTISVVQGRRDAPDLVLEYTAGPASPRPPFQAAPPPTAGGSIVDIDFWMKQILKIPSPF
jgi:hypothetical protein